jgi:hypothetical protein
VGVVAQRAPGQGEEHVVQGRPGQVDRLQRDVGRVEHAEQRGQRLLAVLHGQLDRAVGRADLADDGLVGEQLPGGAGPVLPAGHPERHHVAGDAPLQLVGRALGRDHPVIDDEHPVAQDVRFLQVVRGEEDRGAQVGPEPGYVLPQVASALRIQAGGRLVQEDQRRAVHQPERDLQPPPLPAGQRLDQPLLKPGQVELPDQQLRPLPRLGLRAGADAVQRGLVQQLLDDQAGRVVPPIVSPMACGT